MGHLATPEALVLRWAEVRRDPSRRQLGGAVLTECSVLTTTGIRVPDLAWHPRIS